MSIMNPNLHLDIARNPSFSNVSGPGSGSVSGSNSATGSGFRTPLDNSNGNPFQLQFQQSRNRTDSLISVETNHEQQQLPQLYQCNSATSISSSIFSEIPSNNPLDSYDFTQTFDDELINFYNNYATQPNITPFNIDFPPSGILSKISKLFYNNLISSNIKIDNNIDIHNDLITDVKKPLCLTLIRLRILALCQPQDQFASNPVEMSRTNSYSSLSFNLPSAFSSDQQKSQFQFQSQVPPHPQPQSQFQSQPSTQSRPSWLHSNPAFLSQRLSSTDSLVDSVQISSQTPIHSQQFDFPVVSNNSYNNINNNNNNTNNNTTNNSNNNKPQLTLLQNFNNNLFPQVPPSLQSPFDLQSPFEQSFPSPLHATHSQSNAHNFLSRRSNSINSQGLNQEDPLYNVTAQRKRDSLKLKRGPVLP